ncbi:hypothetical protein N7E81_17845 [Reichenbachiella carrageenanivorans]|uniref:Uncharacterized protein n=1 Tax=Reichenbachiella carrageenanivorans TaxID=2979869 RepID=A0ABY6D0J1_9BACT|nr:hypothetical protein [Reichenbachiella carrageenanivorans]UXX79219.1 hypothetical protein N7E81_17845 [Reichenbachiella carrageenanivorans]
MKHTHKKRKGILSKLFAGATAGVTVGLATYLYFKNGKIQIDPVDDQIVSEDIDTKVNLFV